MASTIPAPKWPILASTASGLADAQLDVYNTLFRAWLLLNARTSVPCLDTACPAVIAISEAAPAGNTAAIATYTTNNEALYYIILSALPESIQADYNIAPYIGNGYLTWRKLFADGLGLPDARHLRALDMISSIDPSTATTVAELRTISTKLTVAQAHLTGNGHTIPEHLIYLLYLRNSSIHDKNFEMYWKGHVASVPTDGTLEHIQTHYLRFRSTGDGHLSTIVRPKPALANVAFASSGAPRTRPTATTSPELPWRCPACGSTRHALPTECHIDNPICTDRKSVV